ncbi:phosphatase PAP2 family protein [Streptomyces sp. Je 1-369]|uniref:phosphatase PAP2 family protein n=1 Tax=Streptomyces sp. Je 1-369 TaxID=2966192 RepID=UPI0022853D2E|nr:phosphatase PAP2 family protein [Streptomyces sp. Je 1-369]WAL98177.1 phosphatase PAP2 family protein [Streptomyces sp. Je 1-369]
MSATPAPRRPALTPSLSVLLFTLLTWQVVAEGPLRRADERAARALTGSRLPDRAAEFLADLGNATVAVPVLVAVAAYTAWHARRSGTFRWWLPAVAALVAMAAVPALVAPLKAVIDRPGPPGMAGDGGFYPSGHAATAAVAYGAAVLLLLPLLRGAYGRRELVIGCCLLNVAIGFGLVRRGYHWPLDVVASWCLAAVLLWAMVLVVSRSTRRSSSRTPGC